MINPASFHYAANGTSQSRVAQAGDLSPAHLSEMLAGTKGATLDVAERLAAALTELQPDDREPVPAEMLFPELVRHRVLVRHFVAPLIDEEDAA